MPLSLNESFDLNKVLKNDEISYWCVYKIVLIYNVFLKIHLHYVKKKVKPKIIIGHRGNSA